MSSDSRAAVKQKGPKLHIKAACPQNRESSSVKPGKVIPCWVDFAVLLSKLSLLNAWQRAGHKAECLHKCSLETKLLLALSNLWIPPWIHPKADFYVHCAQLEKETASIVALSWALLRTVFIVWHPGKNSQNLKILLLAKPIWYLSLNSFNSRVAHAFQI